MNTYVTPLGRNQLAILRTLDDSRFSRRYRAGCGWEWKSHKQTVKILETLVRRGLVVITSEKVRPLIHPDYMADVYRLTPAGEAVLEGVTS